MKYLAQTLAYAVFAGIVGLFSVWPQYRLLGDDQGVVSLTFSHAGQRLEECRRLTQEELDELPPNMRKPTDCPRGRHPIRVEFRVDGELVYRETLPSSGVWADGKATVYQRLHVGAGAHELVVGMNDSGGDVGFDYEMKLRREISPGQNLVVGFDERQQRFLVQ